ncbi:MAG: preprotein translocase subunit SecA [Actinobacteria bacterium]|nr:preprotein translocase subunit SecA [Actinomycetota bacterium]
MGLLERVLRLGEGRKLKILEERVVAANALEPEIEKLSDEELRAKTSEFKARLAEGESLDGLLPEAFAVVREASKRTLGMRHFDVQIMGGVVLHEGKIAEMRTGEGKTLVATLPVYLNALTGRGVHVVTVNDYLARRDAEWMGQIYRFLGLSVGVIQNDSETQERRAAYNSDVTYGTNNEFGFDYLRDNMVIHLEERVQRDFHYAIVDEVDSILIDEARTPLIISGAPWSASALYVKVNQAVASMRLKIQPREPITPEDKEDDAEFEEKFDYIVYEKERHVKETARGQEKIARAFGYRVEDLFGGEYEEERREELSFDELIKRDHIRNISKQAMVAHSLYRKDRDYVIKDGEIIIVDEFTGRLMFGRRYSEGLHQAIEAKEGVKIREENQTLATITLQNYFRMYEKLAGMTGTAATEADEFREIYKLETVVIPTNKPMIRADLPDLIYQTEEAKYNAVIEDIIDCNGRGQPVLVGTVSIEKNEHLSKLLSRRGIAHQVLNAKHHEREAEIIAQAGRKEAVTIATNMAGRGVDIILGGSPPAVGAQREVIEAGGLHVIGTERHEARRIDNQLRGRSGRQGDPGSSRFYLSTEDDLMRLFGGDRVKAIMERLSFPEEEPIEHSLITKTIETAQRQVEAQNFSIRKNVLEYDDVMNTQREVIYKERARVLTGENLKDQIEEMTDEVLEGLVAKHTAAQYEEEWDLQGLADDLPIYIPISVKAADFEDLSPEEITERLYEIAREIYARREEGFGEELLRELEKMVMLQAIDERWRDHLREMDILKEGIWMRSMGQRDPLVEYKAESYEMFQALIGKIKEDVVRYIFHVQVHQEPVEAVPQPVVTNAGGEPRREAKSDKIGRNDPCPCGSGKKYKKCCGAQ